MSFTLKKMPMYRHQVEQAPLPVRTVLSEDLGLTSDCIQEKDYTHFFCLSFLMRHTAIPCFRLTYAASPV